MFRCLFLEITKPFVSVGVGIVEPNHVIDPPISPLPASCSDYDIDIKCLGCN